MDAYENMLTRRSVRKFERTPITEAEVEKLLRAAMYAPSACNRRPWEFIVIDDPAILAKLPEVHPHAPMAAQAPLSILVCGDVNREHPSGYWVVDCAAAVENLLLAAHAIGLGAVWTGIYPREERIVGMQRLLNLPANIRPHALVVIGHAAESPVTQERYEKERVHYNGFTAHP